MLWDCTGFLRNNGNSFQNSPRTDKLRALLWCKLSPVSPGTSHGNACAGTTDKNHTESRTQLLQTLPFHPGSIWNPPRHTYSHTELLKISFKDLEKQKNRIFSSKLPKKPNKNVSVNQILITTASYPLFNYSIFQKAHWCSKKSDRSC